MEKLDTSRSEYRIKALTCVLVLGGVVGIVDPLLTYRWGSPPRSWIAFGAGCTLLGLIPFLRRTGAIRATMFIGIGATSLVFLGNFLLYGDPYFFAIGFVIPVASALFLPTRDAIGVLIAFSLLAVGIAVGIQSALWEPPYRRIDSSMLLQLTLNGILVIAAVAVSAIWKEMLLSRLADREQLQRRRLRTVLDNGYGSLLEASADGTIYAVSGTLATELGYDEKRLIGRHQLTLVSREDRHSLRAIKKSADGLVNYDREVRILDADGNPHWVRLSGGSFRDSRGNLHWVNAVQDIDQQFKQREHVAELSRMESLSNLCAGLAHDFNNLLTVIGIHSELIEDSETRVNILSAQRQAADLTAGLLTFARKQEFRDRRINLSEFFLDMRPLIDRLVPATIRCQWDLQCAGVCVCIDPDQLRQVVINLVTNSQHAMPDGGVLTIRVTKSDIVPDEVLDNTDEPDTMAILEISDNGTGMNTEVRRRAAEPFFTTKPRGKGTGLGLATVHGVVRRAGGTMLLQSREKHGTTVTIYLPINNSGPCSESANNKSQPDEVTNGLRPGLSILLIDDRAEVNRAVRKIFESKRCEVTSASNAETGLKILDQRPVDLVVADVVLPGMSGVAFANAVLKAKLPTRVILISGYQQQELDIVADNPNAIRFLPKPFSQHAILEVSQDLLSNVPA